MTSLLAMPELRGGRRPSVALVGDVDLSIVELAEVLIRDVLRRQEGPVVLDMGLVTLFGAAGVHLIAKLLVEGLEVEFVDASAQVRRVLRICGLAHHPRLSYHNTSGDQQELDL